jgi:hypothetical protein
VEREPLGDDDVIAASELVDKAGFERHAPVAGEMGGVTGAAQQALHLVRPLFLLDVAWSSRRWWALHKACSTPSIV